MAASSVPLAILMIDQNSSIKEVEREGFPFYYASCIEEGLGSIHSIAAENVILCKEQELISSQLLDRVLQRFHFHFCLGGFISDRKLDAYYRLSDRCLLVNREWYLRVGQPSFDCEELGFTRSLAVGSWIEEVIDHSGNKVVHIEPSKSYISPTGLLQPGDALIHLSLSNHFHVLCF